MIKLKLFCLVTLTALTLSSCKKDKNSPDNETFTLVEEQTIGSSGGAIGSQETILLEVPAGAFVSSANLKLYSSDAENPFGEDGGSDVFYIDGIPENLAKDLKISFPFSGQQDEGNAVIKGRLSIATSTFDTVFAPEFLQTHDSTGFLVAVIPAQEDLSRENARLKGASVTHGVPFYIVRGYRKTETEHFIIRHPPKYSGDPAIDKIAEGLEGAYSLLNSWGFTYHQRTKWPLEVIVKFLKSDEIWGQTDRSFPYTANYGYIEINRMNLYDFPKAKITAAHEFFHIVQDFYNVDEKYNWLQEASSTWFEQFFAAEPGNYIPSVFEDNFKQPFIGLQAGRESGQGDHGYGCSSVIKYLMEKNNASNNPSAIRSIWEATTNNYHPVRILLDYQAAQQDWWDDFLYQYYIDDIYPVVTKKFNDSYYKADVNKQYLFAVKSKTDNFKQFNNQGTDLSGAVYRISLERSDFTNGSHCKISLTNGQSYLYVFKLDPDGYYTELLGEVSVGSELNVNGLKEDFYEENCDIVVLLCNKSVHPDFGYEYSSPTQILVEIIDEEEQNTITYYETSADNSYPYYSGQFGITIETDNNYPFFIGKEEYYTAEGIKVKNMSICFDPPSGSEIVTFNIYIDTLSLASTYPGKVSIKKATWQVADLHQVWYLYPDPTEVPFHLVAEYSNTISAGAPCSLWLDLETPDPYSSNILGVLNIDFNASCP